MSQMPSIRSDPLLDIKPLDLVFCVDRSASMSYGREQSKLAIAKQLVKELVKNLSVEDKVALVTFDSTSNISFPLTSISQLKNFEAILTAISERGNTCLASGLKTSMEAFESATRTKRAIILSDGRDNLSFDGSGGFEGSISLELELKECGITLDGMGVKAVAVAIGTDAFPMPLKVVADASGGCLILRGLRDVHELVTALRSDTISLPRPIKSPLLEKSEMEIASFPSELPASQPTWSLESLYEHVAVVSEEMASTCSTVGEALICNRSNQRFAKTALMSIEKGILKNYRERLPKTTKRIRSGEVILLDKSYRLELDLEKESVVDLRI